MSTFHVLGAFDRFNYGDVIFAHLAAATIREHRPDAQIAYYGTTRSDLRLEGGVRTEPLDRLYRNGIGTGDVIWIAGGEVLASRWILMLEHSLPHRAARLLRQLRRRLGMERIDALYRRMTGAKNILPWVLDPSDFLRDCTPVVIYNNVGGRGIAKLAPAPKAWAKAALGRATWLSVRDSGSRQAVAEVTGNRPEIFPDPAVLMDGLLSRDDLLMTRKGTMQRMAGLSDRHIVLQCGINYYNNHEGILADAILRLHDATDLPIVLFAIGRAAGHEDQVVARSLSVRIGPKPWLYIAPEDMDIWEIMALIAGAACYVGTSLHGFITAHTFDVPRVGLSPRVGKIIGFRDDWDLPEMPAGVEFIDIPKAVGHAMAADLGRVVQRRHATQALCRDGLDKLWTVLPLG